MIRVLARFRCGAAETAAVRAVLEGMIVPTRSEPGCHRYDLHGLDDGFLLDEVYEDEAALQAHRTTAHYIHYRAAIGPLLRGPIEVLLPIPLDVS